jgi:hypothetical protein
MKQEKRTSSLNLDVGIWDWLDKIKKKTLGGLSRSTTANMILKAGIERINNDLQRSQDSGISGILQAICKDQKQN